MQSPAAACVAADQQSWQLFKGWQEMLTPGLPGLQLWEWVCFKGPPGILVLIRMQKEGLNSVLPKRSREDDLVPACVPGSRCLPTTPSCSGWVLAALLPAVPSPYAQKCPIDPMGPSQ